MVFLRRLVYILLLAACVWTEKLISWNEGYDAGYGSAIADAFVDEKKPEKFFKQQAGVKPCETCASPSR